MAGLGLQVDARGDPLVGDLLEVGGVGLGPHVGVGQDVQGGLGGGVGPEGAVCGPGRGDVARPRVLATGVGVLQAAQLLPHLGLEEQRVRGADVRAGRDIVVGDQRILQERAHVLLLGVVPEAVDHVEEDLGAVRVLHAEVLEELHAEVVAAGRGGECSGGCGGGADLDADAAEVVAGVDGSGERAGLACGGEEVAGEVTELVFLGEEVGDFPEWVGSAA